MLKQVFIINKELKMSKGKIAVQTAHGAIIYMDKIKSLSLEKQMFGDLEQYGDTENVTYSELYQELMLKNHTEWMKGGMMKKIVLKSTEQEMHDIMKNLIDKIWLYAFRDFGLTQVPENSFTCIVTEPITEEQHKEFFGELKLL